MMFAKATTRLLFQSKARIKAVRRPNTRRKRDILIEYSHFVDVMWNSGEDDLAIYREA